MSAYAGKKAFVFDVMINDPNNICDRPKTYLAEDDVMKILRGSRYIIIPLRDRHKIYGPIGATALLDAMALCKPVICSDNFYLSSDVRKYNIGMVYEADNLDSLVDCLSKINDDTMRIHSSNMKRYSEMISIYDYSNKVFKIINQV